MALARGLAGKPLERLEAVVEALGSTDVEIAKEEQVSEENLKPAITEVAEGSESAEEAGRIGRREAVKLGVATVGGLALGAVYLSPAMTSSQAEAATPTTGGGTGDQASITVAKDVTAITAGDATKGENPNHLYMRGTITITNTSSADVQVDVIYWQDEVYDRATGQGGGDILEGVYVSSTPRPTITSPVGDRVPVDPGNLPSTAKLISGADSMISGLLPIDTLPKGDSRTVSFGLDITAIDNTNRATDKYRNTIFVWITQYTVGGGHDVFSNSDTWP